MLNSAEIEIYLVNLEMPTITIVGILIFISRTGFDDLNLKNSIDFGYF